MKRKVISLMLRGCPLSGRTLYDPKHNKFIHIKSVYLKGAECGGHTTFYSDAHTTTPRQMLSYDYLANCILVDCIDKCSFAVMDKSVHAWRAKTRGKSQL